jgi:hypothetical protein
MLRRCLLGDYRHCLYSCFYLMTTRGGSKHVVKRINYNTVVCNDTVIFCFIYFDVGEWLALLFHVLENKSCSENNFRVFT